MCRMRFRPDSLSTVPVSQALQSVEEVAAPCGRIGLAVRLEADRSFTISAVELGVISSGTAVCTRLKRPVLRSLAVFIAVLVTPLS